ncbi:hypothetical protein NLC35_00450 [Candidatus Aminicenantes bacterium AC-334-K16]|jgi:hypothetical protein|nr:hypothetical protein [Candidatus Aminicenantes bacterium AC-334-K16]
MRLFLCDQKKEIVIKASKYLRKWGLENINLSSCPIKEKTNLAPDFAANRIISPESQQLNAHPLPVEIQFEEKRLRECGCGKGAVYDGYRYAELAGSSLPKKLDYQVEKPVFITLDYIATFPEAEGRYHLRYAVFSFPVVVSLVGIIEAPARPREYYLSQTWGASLPQGLEKNFLTDLDDARLPRVLAGLLLQAWFYYKDGYPFCSDPKCALFNAHWQKDLLRSQSDEPYILCPKHAAELSLEPASNNSE